jgi:hypothetical protein
VEILALNIENLCMKKHATTTTTTTTITITTTNSAIQKDTLNTQHKYGKMHLWKYCKLCLQGHLLGT